MGRSLDHLSPGPPSSPAPLPHRVSSVPRARCCAHRTRFLLLAYRSLLFLGAVGSTSAWGVETASVGVGVGGGGGAAASAVLLLTAFASNIDPSWQLTCYTCVNVTDNQVCNRFAIDRPCPEDKQFCHSLHVLEGFGSKGDSLLVNKGCAGDDECNRKSIGCRREGGQTSCNACCDYEYCNEKAPVDAETATFVQTKSLAVESTALSPFAALFAFGPLVHVLNGIRDFVAET